MAERTAISMVATASRVGADKAYDTRDLMADLRTLGAAPHIAHNTSNRRQGVQNTVAIHSGSRSASADEILEKAHAVLLPPLVSGIRPDRRSAVFRRGPGPQLTRQLTWMMRRLLVVPAWAKGMPATTTMLSFGRTKPSSWPTLMARSTISS